MPIFRQSFARPTRLRSFHITETGPPYTKRSGALRRIEAYIFRKPSQKIAPVNGELPSMIGRHLVI